MRMVMLAMVLLFGIAATDAAAQSHSHTPLNQKSAIEIAELVVIEMVGKKAVDASWREAELIKAERRTSDGKAEWVVLFDNPKAADASRKILYVFLDNFGHYLAANYTGK